MVMVMVRLRDRVAITVRTSFDGLSQVKARAVDSTAAGGDGAIGAGDEALVRTAWRMFGSGAPDQDKDLNVNGRARASTHRVRDWVCVESCDSRRAQRNPNPTLPAILTLGRRAQSEPI